ncbi:MAG: NUDIX domain-containing protein [Clostridiales bacterium]|nr:NUDIX domain-containing protein [Clostridiales bacterium]
MLGKNVRVRVTKPYNSIDSKTGMKYELNFGVAEIKTDRRSFIYSACILGINHPVNIFEGKVIAIVRHQDKRPNYIVVAPKKSRYINFQIQDKIGFLEKDKNFTLECLYESSCGAVVYRIINGTRRFLLIKNKRSNHWGFPKGHIERGEDEFDTAKREVLEETGIHIRILKGFKSTSEYKIAGRVEKKVTIFLASTSDTQTVIQREEIEDYIWLDYSGAIETLKFENDKNILAMAKKFLDKSE